MQMTLILKSQTNLLYTSVHPLPPPPAVRRPQAGAHADGEFELRVAEHEEEFKVEWEQKVLGCRWEYGEWDGGVECLGGGEYLILVRSGREVKLEQVGRRRLGMLWLLGGKEIMGDDDGNDGDTLRGGKGLDVKYSLLTRSPLLYRLSSAFMS